MKLTLKSLIYIFIVSLFILSSCSKEGEVGAIGPQGEQGIQGPQGPQGPAGQDATTPDATGSDDSQAGGVVEGEQGTPGEQGPQGEPGEDGEDGKDGDDGNANVTDSGWLPAEFTSGRMRVENPDLTSDVVNNSVVMVFGLWSDGDEYIFQFPHQIGDEKFSFYLINDGPGAPFVINLLAEGVDGNPMEEVFRCDAVKYFIVPSNALTGKNSYENLKKMNYEEVIKNFNLEY